MPILLLNFSNEIPARLLLAYFKAQGISAHLNIQLVSLDKPSNAGIYPQSSILCEKPRDSLPESTDILTINTLQHMTVQEIHHPVPCEQTPPKVVYALNIDNETDQTRAISIANTFLQSPHDRKYQKAAWDSGDTSIVAGSMFSGLEFEALSQWRKHLFTHVVGLFIVSVYLFMHVGYDQVIFDTLNIQYYQQLSQNQQWWRLLGPTFMHGGLAHLVMNLCWWWILASRLERIFGSSSVAILFVVSALVANVVQLMHTGPGFGGMSSVNYALFGFIACIGYLRPNWGLSLPSGIIIFLLAWLGIGYLDILWVTTSDDLHLFGMLTGAVLALLVHFTTTLVGTTEGRQ
jgi:GlpG protein